MPVSTERLPPTSLGERPLITDWRPNCIGGFPMAYSSRRPGLGATPLITVRRTSTPQIFPRGVRKIFETCRLNEPTQFSITLIRLTIATIYDAPWFANEQFQLAQEKRRSAIMRSLPFYILGVRSVGNRAKRSRREPERMTRPEIAPSITLLV